MFFSSKRWVNFLFSETWSLLHVHEVLKHGGYKAGSVKLNLGGTDYSYSVEIGQNWDENSEDDISG